MTINWSASLAGQLEFYWQVHLWPRLAGLTDEEYFWEPVPGCWSLRPAGDGRWRMEQGDPASGAVPFTTISWRMTHLSVEVFESRYRAFFGGEGPHQWSAGYRLIESGALPGDAVTALDYLQGAYTRWHDAIAGLSEAQLREPLGPKGADFAEFPMAELILHLNRETMHHGAEICLLRDLYRDTPDHTTKGGQ